MISRPSTLRIVTCVAGVPAGEEARAPRLGAHASARAPGVAADECASSVDGAPAAVTEGRSRKSASRSRYSSAVAKLSNSCDVERKAGVAVHQADHVAPLADQKRDRLVLADGHADAAGKAGNRS